MTDRTTRRRLLAGLGTVATASVAGCSGDAENEGDGGDGGDASPTATGTPTTIPPATSDDVPAAIDDFLSEAPNYDDQIIDRTGQGGATVALTSENVFDPPAVRIDASATVEWRWEGGTHNVVSTEESASNFDSGDPTSDTSTTFSQSFDDTGVQLYVCEVHEGGGMLGAIDVV